MNTPSPDNFYNLNIAQWIENEDFYMGERAVKHKRQAYLKAPGKMDEDSYELFLDRAMLLNAVGRTVEGMIGLIFRKKPVFNELKSINLKNIDANGMDVSELARECLKKMVISSRVGVLIEHPEIDAPLTKKQARDLNILPYVVVYDAKEIISTATKTINGKEKLCQVCLKVKELKQSEDNEFYQYECFKYIVLDLVETEQGPVYRYRSIDENGQVEKECYPQSNGQYMSCIPFEVIELEKNGKALIEDLVKANAHHFKISASYTHGIYYTGFPTVTATGVSEEETNNFLDSGLGPNSFWTSNNEAAQFNMLEFKGSGLNSAKEYLEGVVETMAALGADMLKTSKNSAETEGSKRLDKQASDSTLINAAFKIETALNKIVNKMIAWSMIRTDEEFEIALNKDFNDYQMDSSMLKELTSSLLQGVISYDTFWENLQKGEIAKPNVSAEQESEKIKMSDL